MRKRELGSPSYVFGEFNEGIYLLSKLIALKGIF